VPLVVGRSAGAAIVPTVPLATAADFAVLGGSTVTNTGPTTMGANLGVWPGSAVTGFPPGIVGPPGVIHATDAVAQQAQSDLTTAYVNAAGRPIDATTTADLANLTLGPGVYAVREHGHAHQRCAGVQRLLAGGQLGDLGHQLGLRRQHPGADLHLGHHRRHRARSGPRPQRCGHAGHRHLHQPDLQRGPADHHDHRGRVDHDHGTGLDHDDGPGFDDHDGGAVLDDYDGPGFDDHGQHHPDADHADHAVDPTLVGTTGHRRPALHRLTGRADRLRRPGAETCGSRVDGDRRRHAADARSTRVGRAGVPASATAAG
jgi:hypothetical protein